MTTMSPKRAQRPGTAAATQICISKVAFHLIHRTTSELKSMEVHQTAFVGFACKHSAIIIALLMLALCPLFLHLACECTQAQAAALAKLGGRRLLAQRVARLLVLASAIVRQTLSPPSPRTPATVAANTAISRAPARRNTTRRATA